MPLPAGWVLAPPITLDQAAAHAFRAGFRGEGGAIILAIALAESSLIPNNRNVNSDSRHTVDRGILQFNSYWHPEVTDAEADSPAAAFAAAWDVTRGGTAFGQWATYNGGNYKKHLGATRAAMAAAEGRAGGAGAPSGALPVIETVNVDAVTGDIISTYVPATLLDAAVPPLTVDAVQVRGQRLARLSFAPWVTAAALELTVDEASKLALSIADPIPASASSGYFTVGTELDLGDLRFRATDVGVGPASDALEVLSVTALAAGVEKLRETESLGTAKTWQNMSAAEVLLEEATRAGLQLVAEGGPVYPTLTRLGRADAEEGEGSTKHSESDWDFADRLARREGRWRFEAAGTLYYGKPTWLVERLTRFTVRWRVPPGPGWLTPLEAPQLSVGVDEETPGRVGGPREISVLLPRGIADRIRPGMVMLYDGTTGWNTKQFSTASRIAGYLVTAVRIDLLDEGAGVAVDAREAIDPEPVPEEGDETDPSSADGLPAEPATGRSTGGGSALDMVTHALAQVGDTYRYGAEADPKNPDPDEFDCSELVQWACAQVGVTFVDGTGAQIGAIARAGLEISVAEASKIRGALLWRPGHIAISLGDGSRTVEARGRKYGVVEYLIKDRFERAGKVPGLNYGASPVIRRSTPS